MVSNCDKILVMASLSIKLVCFSCPKQFAPMSSFALVKFFTWCTLKMMTLCLINFKFEVSMLR